MRDRAGALAAGGGASRSASRSSPCAPARRPAPPERLPAEPLARLRGDGGAAPAEFAADPLEPVWTAAPPAAASRPPPGGRCARARWPFVVDDVDRPPDHLCANLGDRRVGAARRRAVRGGAQRECRERSGHECRGEGGDVGVAGSAGHLVLVLSTKTLPRAPPRAAQAPAKLWQRSAPVSRLGPGGAEPLLRCAWSSREVSGAGDRAGGRRRRFGFGDRSAAPETSRARRWSVWVVAGVRGEVLAGGCVRVGAVVRRAPVGGGGASRRPAVSGSEPRPMCWLVSWLVAKLMPAASTMPSTAARAQSAVLPHHRPHASRRRVRGVQAGRSLTAAPRAA